MSLAHKFKQIPRYADMADRHERNRHHYNRFPDVNGYEGDGIDHVNVGNSARTELGHLLSNGHLHNFQHPILGGFRSIEGYWNYVKTADDRFRYATKNVKHLSRSIKSRNVRGFRFLVLEGVYCKLMSLRQKLIKLMEKDGKLPLDIYYDRKISQEEENASYINIRVPYFEWYLPGLKEVVEAVVENRPPVLDRYMDRMTPDEIYAQFITVRPNPAPKPAAAKKAKVERTDELAEDTYGKLTEESELSVEETARLIAEIEPLLEPLVVDEIDGENVVSLEEVSTDPESALTPAAQSEY